MEARLHELAGVFCIDVCAYAVMSNHLHVVLHINENKALSLSFDGVIKRWHQIFSGNLLSQRYLKEETLSESERLLLGENVETWRARLSDLSWFMRCLNEPIARQANEEDQCTGRFWEGRFKTQALLDEAALAACMAYVDLNPVRAQIAETPEDSDFTSIKRRVEKVRNNEADDMLYPFFGNPRDPMPDGLPFKLKDYIELVDWSARQLRENKAGALSEAAPPVLKRIGISEAQWEICTAQFESHFSTFVGSCASLDQLKTSKHFRRTQHRSHCQAAFG